MLDWKGIIIISAIAATAVTLSIISYESATLTSHEIVKVATDDINANVDAQAYDLSRIISSKIRSIYENLEILANGPAVQAGDYRTPASLFSAAESSTNDLTDYYMWINGDGKIVLSSNMIRAAYEHPATDLRTEPLFTVPMRTQAAYFSNLTSAPNAGQKLYVSYPILYSLNDNASEVGAFKGVVAASIDLETLGSLLQNELNPGLDTDGLALLDNSGIVIYATDKTLIGKDAFTQSGRSIISSHASDDLPGVNGIIKSSLGNTGLQEIVIDKQAYTLAYRPITHNGKQLWTLFVWTPHDFASSVDDLVDKQNNFGILLIFIIGIITIGTAYLVLTWNGRLARTVNLRTRELRSSNSMLEQSNSDLLRANEQLQIHNKMQQEFVNVAAHELRTPITPIVALAEMIESDSKDKETIVLERSEFDMISRNARRLARLSSEILDTTRIESHSLQLNKEEFGLDDVISVAIEDAKHELAAMNMHVKISYKPSGIYVEADKARITQVILNFLSNAVKFTAQGDIRLSASITEDNEFAVVSVRDTGTGIDPEILPRLFAKFATKSHVDGPQTGTGLGLFIAKSIVDAHGGKMWAENNRDGTGATFSFSLPLRSVSKRNSSDLLDAGTLNPTIR